MKYLMEQHRYAPELNRVYRITKQGDQVLVGKSGIRNGFHSTFLSLKEFREQNAPAKPGIWAVVKTHYPEAEHKGLERTYAGRVASRAQALAFARERKQGLLPSGTVSVKTSLVG